MKKIIIKNKTKNMKQSNELVLTSNDLQTAGINSQLSSNDLVEVVAHDIYDKYLENINSIVDAGKKLYDEYYDLLKPEADKMKKALGKYISKKTSEVTVNEEDYYDEELSGITISFGKVDEYWPPVSLHEVIIREKDKGTTIDINHRNMYIPSLKDKKPKVKLTITTGSITTNEDIKVGAITGDIENTTKKTFKQTVVIPIARFAAYAEKVNRHNKEVSILSQTLPKNGVLSVERFTRDARVKMNKKLISAQSPDFKEKISKLFNIKL